MVASDVIRPSDSPFSSHIVLVRKKDGSLRFCVDYRMLRKDAYMLPRFDDTVDALSDARFFSKLDLRSAYWQVERHEPGIEKTAFYVGNLGHWEFSRMSFGLCNAPSTFQRLSELCLSSLNIRDCLVFLDDIFDVHIERLESVFKRMEDHGMKLKPSKCELFKLKVEYLGHVVSADGISTYPVKTCAVVDWPAPPM